MEDLILVNAYKDGDTNSFSEIYEKYIDDIYRFVYRKTGDKEVSEDLTSDIWIKIFNNIGKYQEQSGATFKSWMYRIAHNTIIDHYRVKKDNVDIEDISEPSIFTDFAQVFDDKETLQNVKKYLQNLSANEQEIVFLRVWDDMSYKEISETLGITVDNCKKIYSRSLKKIQANVTLIFTIILLLL